jgi:hypothetical protein
MTLYLYATCPRLVPEDTVDRSDGVGRCPECVSAGRTVSWPGVRVDPSEFQSLPAHDRLLKLSHGYLKSAISLCHELGAQPERLDWPRASVVYFCIHHAAELFLKACILRRAPPGEKLHHDISRLQDRYCELYPDIKNTFHIETPWDVGLERAEKAFGADLNIEDFEYGPDQVYRYMTGKDLATARGINSFAPGTCLLICRRLESDFERVWLAANGNLGTDRDVP